MSRLWPPLRGRVYAVRAEHLDGEKFFVIVSNNGRNGALPQVLAVRVTTSRKDPRPSIVPLPRGEVVVGNVLCDDISEIWEGEITRDLGALSRPTMQRIDRALKFALALS